MRLERYFTKNLKGPYDLIQFKAFKLLNKNSGGHPAEEVIAPDFWSETAVDIIANKYMKKTGIKKFQLGYESDVRQVIDRLVETWLFWAKKENIFDSAEDESIFGDELKYLLIHQKMAPNSPQWFNTGLYEVYGIKGEQEGPGHYYFDKAKGEVVKSSFAYERSQVHACFIQSLEDTLLGQDGIMELLAKEARLFKFGSGSGTNFSKLREKNASLSGGGVSSGVMSFIKVSDRSAGHIKSGGTTRRAAKMICLDADHPDIFDFIKFKREEEYKVSSLISGSKILSRFVQSVLKVREQLKFQGKLTDYNHFVSDADIMRLEKEGRLLGVPERFMLNTLSQIFEDPKSCLDRKFTTDWQSEAFETVSGQNANFSVRLNHHFFDCLKTGEKWHLKGRVSKEKKEVDAKELMHEMAVSAWSSADPGVQYDDTINEWHTCPSAGRIVASNPCSEYMFLNDTACNLASLNLLSFYDGEKMDLEGFIYAAKLTTIVLDLSVELAHYPSLKLAQNSYDYRTLGLGLTNLGGLLMSMGLSYDCDEARAIAGAITSILTASSLSTSAHLASFLGTFKYYNDSDYKKVVRNHQRASLGKRDGYEGLSVTPLALDHKYLPSDFIKKLHEIWDEAIFKMDQYGVRNAQLTAIAPTGTISILMDCDTTGIEPEFALVKYKELSGGGQYKFVNKSVRKALKKHNYNQSDIEGIEKYILEHQSVEDCTLLKPEHYAIFDCAIAPRGKKRFLHYQAHLLMMASIQPYVSGAISKTVNLPSQTTIEEIEKIYLEGRGLMLKSLALYRQGSKLSEPLTLLDKEKFTDKITLFQEDEEEIQSCPPFKSCPECG